VALPDVVVNVLEAPASGTLPTDTGTAFFAGVTERGPIDGPRLVRSLSDFSTIFGARLTSSVLSDAVETYFAEGGTLLWVSRVFGAGAVAASRNFLDGSSAISLVISAGDLGSSDPGTWGNSLSAAIVTVTGGFRIDVYRSSVLVESSPTLVTQDDAVAWANANSRYVRIAKGVGTVPAAIAATSLNTTAGTDGSAVADADWQGALDRIVPDLGPGQIAAPGRTTSAGQLQVLDHAQTHNRFALLDLADTSSDATLIAAAQALYAAPNRGRRYGQPASPWEVIPGLTATTFRVVPPSARLAAMYARNDALGNPNTAAAGTGNGRGVARFVYDLSQPAWTDAQRKALNEAGVTVARRRYGNSVVTWGARTLADQANDAQWSFAPQVRTVMAFVADALHVGDAHEFDTVDGNGRALADFRGDLSSYAGELFTRGALYGSTVDQAFNIATPDSLNPPARLQAGEMHARAALRTSPTAERVIIDVVKVPITQAVA
jgi:hypothetical protein